MAQAFALAVLFVVTGFDPVRGVLVGVERLRDQAAFDRCMATAAPDDDWTCE